MDYVSLGFSGPKDPTDAKLTKTKCQAILGEMMEACQGYIGGEFLETFRGQCAEILGATSGWGVEGGRSRITAGMMACILGIGLALCFHAFIESGGTDTRPLVLAGFIGTVLMVANATDEFRRRHTKVYALTLLAIGSLTLLMLTGNQTGPDASHVAFVGKVLAAIFSLAGAFRLYKSR